MYDLLSLALQLGQKQGDGNITIIINKEGLEAIWSGPEKDKNARVQRKIKRKT